ncbi:glycerate kinase [Lactobacillus jensenii]|jgi:glycerate kinase|uniref:Glycerate kinase n=4 Tax=Lactobacillus TaxID=1578 RepID=A0A5N1I641_LACJE|nr:glycerate kinase [Lactobacillus jensenii]EEQ69082.1 glycerate kinase [Lactobacillus jensenii 1153]APT14827.1 glycerate 2-kinase [Lactobacillus jensenii]EEQ24527.1 glycerate kinase [Lactobacillus jensenii 269-3]EEX27540.1 glycerate kinase [Lactobacillus jensenii SJ-7A-US]KAA9234567.1 glycerate kinase [Lactobacillus jensenii]
MKILIAPDSFKNCMTAQQVANVMKKGLSRVFPAAEYTLVPMADGGEGTVDALVSATGGCYFQVQVHNPLNQVVIAKYGFLGDKETAVIEMAAASGIQYVNKETMNPMKATTYGTGEMIVDAVNHGAKQIILGIGGSATVDGGSGMAQALGVGLLDKNGQAIKLGGEGLEQLAHVNLSQVPEQIKKTKIYIASDVTNPLTGPQGSTAVFGPQKGATEAMIPILDQNLHHLAQVVKKDLELDYEAVPGSGAAGGLGFGLLAFTNSKMEKGIDLVTHFARLAEKAKGADLVITGEGSTDFQTKFGKTPYGVALTTKKVAPQAPVIVLSGNIGPGVKSLYENKVIDAIFSTPSGAKSLEQAIKDAPKDIALAAEEVGRLIRSVIK